jgi:MoxR-like ATPase
VACSGALLDYVQSLVAATRQTPDFEHGLSPRSGLALLASARAWALVGGREFVLPEDVQSVFAAVAGHRLRQAGSGRVVRAEQLAALLENTPIP